jgi:hypothetical protein
VVGGSVLAVVRFDLGPKPNELYTEERAALSGEQVLAKLLTDLIETDRANQPPLRSKVMRLLIAVGVLLTTILYTTLLLAL